MKYEVECRMDKNMEFRGLCSYNSVARQIEDVTKGCLYISHVENRKCTQVSSVPHNRRQTILMINTAYITGFDLTKKINPLASVLLGEINVDYNLSRNEVLNIQWLQRVIGPAPFMKRCFSILEITSHYVEGSIFSLSYLTTLLLTRAA